MKIVITNTAALNTGDAAILFATIDILRQIAGPRVDITVCDQQPAAAHRYYPDLDFQPVLYDQVVTWTGKRWAKGAIVALLAAAAVWHTPLRRIWRNILPSSLSASLDRFAASDLVVSAGGPNLVPHYRVFPKILDLLIAVALRRPFVLFTQSLGPFPRQRRGWLLRYALRRAQLILVRDSRSRHYLAEFGIPDRRVAECADSVFAMARRLGKSSRDEPTMEGPLRIAISVRDWPHFPQQADIGMVRYREALVALVCHLTERHGARITFLSTCQGVEEYWTDDSRVAENVVGQLPPTVRQSVVVDREFHTPQALLALYAGFDLVVATRMHAAILALCAGVPVLPIAYEFKTIELFRGLGLEDTIQHIESLTGEQLCQHVDRMLAARSGIRAGLPAKVAEARRSALAAGSYVICALGRGA